MDVLQALKERRSCRRFKGLVTDEQLKALQEAAQQAPSAMDRQYCRFTFVRDPEILGLIDRALWTYFRALGDQTTLDRLKSRHQSSIYGAPLCVVITAPDKKYSPFDAGIAAQSLALAATALGLGSVICASNGVFPGGPGFDEVVKALGLPDDHVFQLSVLIGQADDEKAPHSYDGHQVVTV